ncbi:MAG TPA: response regulator transcription factor [Dissulfurispiraceae bacterium]
MRRILVVDDERDIVELISYNLQKEGFAVDSAYDGESALQKIRERAYTLILLDLMLPGVNGLELCRTIKSDPSVSDTSIIMLTAKGEEVDKVLGLEMGADDYITKPFSPRELTARIKAVLRRARPKETPSPEVTGGQGEVLRIRDITIDRARYTVKVGPRSVKLSAKEFKLLLYLCERPNKIFPRERLLDAVWGDDVFVEPRTVDVHIRRLRAKLEADPDNPAYIKTMRGVGYFFEA